MSEREYVRESVSFSADLQNFVDTLSDEQIHAEFVALQRGARKLQGRINRERERMRLYVTAMGMGNECS